MRVCLAAMPWQAVDTPSLAVGILRRRVAEAVAGAQSTEYPGALRWAEYLLAETGAAVTPAHYMLVADKGIGHGLGDWVFTGALRDEPERRHSEWPADVPQGVVDPAVLERMRTLAAGFVAEATAEILALRPDVVGFTSTFMQTVPSLAVARAIKRQRPDVKVVFGGANCDGPMGHAIHRNHRFVDFVVRGEGEIVLPTLLERIEAGKPVADVPGLCWWDGEQSVANAMVAHQTVPPALIPMPDYDAWFAAMDVSPVREYLSPYLFIEGSRGCWWGERHHCTFCGLNGPRMGFRSKPADRFLAELTHLVERHRVLDVMTADNIMDMAYYRHLLPRLAETGWDLRIQFEAKANVSPQQIAQLSAAGVCAVQFGIESLNSRVLKIMNKGVTAATNLRVLRDSDDHHLTVLWNYLYGFPDESEHDYWPVIEQMPALVHLQPPAGATRIGLQRFSPYFEKPELGFAHRRPAKFYGRVYDVPEAELEDLAYFFECDDAGIAGGVEKALVEAIADWRANHPFSSLFRMEGPDRTLTLRDRRRGWPRRDHVLTGWRRDAYEALDRGRTEESLRRFLAEQEITVDAADLHDWLSSLRRHGLVFAEGDEFVALATTDVPVRMRTDD
ncbi:MAG TPA: RiPP maturation radical SAM C-methyltransferase [Nonomuraea sp.]|nr:RiPP maturation radical SAM C-methyltransferase [Nonomuraea sp.]